MKSMFKMVSTGLSLLIAAGLIAGCDSKDTKPAAAPAVEKKVEAKVIKAGIGLNDFAARLGVSPGYWSRVERGQEKAPRDALIERAAAILGIRLDELFIAAQRLPPDMQRDLPRVVFAYRRLRAAASR